MMIAVADVFPSTHSNKEAPSIIRDNMQYPSSKTQKIFSNRCKRKKERKWDAPVMFRGQRQGRFISVTISLVRLVVAFDLSV
jgi:hypothetical protein